MDDKDASIKARDTEIAQYGILTKKQSDDIAEKDKQLSAWYRNPFIWGAVGFGLGVYLIKR